MLLRQSFFCCLVVLAVGLVSGCAGVADVAPEVAGLGAGAGAGVLTANPLIGVAVGLGARLATAEALGAVEASHQRELQHAIASAAGGEPIDETAHWSTDPSAMNRLLFGRTSGSVQVAREFGGRIRCREILYTTDGDGGVLGVADAAEADVDAIAESGKPAPASDQDEGAAPAGEEGAVPAAESDHRSDRDDAVADVAGSTEKPGSPAENDSPAEPKVLVAVICRGANKMRWHWAVSEPAG